MSNFAIPFVQKFKYLNNENVQFNINFKPKIKQLENFLTIYGSHRINIYCSDFNYDKDIQIVKLLKEKFDFVLCFPEYSKELESKLNKDNLPHFYQEMIYTWDRFFGFLDLNVTDIVIGNEFAFNLKTIAEKAKEKNKKIRCYCNICQSTWEENSGIKTFFIRPEDIELYSNYIDTFSFVVEEKDFVRINTLYEIYSEKQKWFGQLKELIINYTGEEDSRFILPLFSEKRLNCGKKCILNNLCHICDRIIDLGESLKEKNLIIKTSKEYIEYENGN